jgi:uncharacterized protein
MVESRSQINKLIERYREELQRSGIHVTRVYLYGSYAQGTEHEGSDIDLVIISPDFVEMNLRERLEMLGLAAARILEPIQAYAFTPYELKNKQFSSFWSNIFSNEALLV